MFRLKIISSPTAVEKMRTQGSALIMAITNRMNILMFKLHAKIVGEKIPIYFPKGAPNIAGSVRAVPAEVDGTKIRGRVEAGGPRTTKVTLGGPNAGQAADYAALQESGVAHGWKIEPVYWNTAWALNQKSRATSVQGLPKALAFMMNGKQIIVRSVFHPGLRSRPFMRSALHDMEAQIVSELEAEFNGFLQ